MKNQAPRNGPLPVEGQRQTAQHRDGVQPLQVAGESAACDSFSSALFWEGKGSREGLLSRLQPVLHKARAESAAMADWESEGGRVGTEPPDFNGC